MEPFAFSLRCGKARGRSPLLVVALGDLRICLAIGLTDPTTRVLASREKITFIPTGYFAASSACHRIGIGHVDGRARATNCAGFEGSARSSVREARSVRVRKVWLVEYIEKLGPEPDLDSFGRFPIFAPREIPGFKTWTTEHVSRHAGKSARIWRTHHAVAFGKTAELLKLAGQSMGGAGGKNKGRESRKEVPDPGPRLASTRSKTLPVSCLRLRWRRWSEPQPEPRSQYRTGSTAERRA